MGCTASAEITTVSREESDEVETGQTLIDLQVLGSLVCEECNFRTTTSVEVDSTVNRAAAAAIIDLKNGCPKNNKL